jgi:hypothetical protein
MAETRGEFLIENDPILVRDYLNKFEQLWIAAVDARRRLSELKANSS